MSNAWTMKDGWKTKGVKQLTKQNVQRACHLAEALEAQGVLYSIVIGCRTEHEMETASEAWAGLRKVKPGTLSYKNVVINKT
jgi:hypothetical protein